MKSGDGDDGRCAWMYAASPAAIFSGRGGIPFGGKSFLARQAACRILPENNALQLSMGTALVSGTQMKVNTLYQRQLPPRCTTFDERAKTYAVKKQSAEKKKNVPFASTTESIMYGKTNVRMN
jgi:hypothetical protein